MSLGIVFKGPEGIVLAADSRVTLTTKDEKTSEIFQAHYDNATKLLRVNGQCHVGAVTYGLGAIGQRSPRTAHSYLPEFEGELANSGSDRLTVESFTSKLSDFFVRQWQAADMPAETPPMVFLVGGYDRDAPYGRVFELSVPGAPEPKEWYPGPGEFGMVWGGQKEFTDRLITGYDAQVPDIAQQVLGLSEEQKDSLAAELKKRVQAQLPFAFLPLQDCVDLSMFMIRTTVAMQNWVIGIRGVGGSIDVATITRMDGYTPVQQKSISGERFGYPEPRMST